MTTISPLLSQYINNTAPNISYTSNTPFYQNTSVNNIEQKTDEFTKNKNDKVKKTAALASLITGAGLLILAYSRGKALNKATNNADELLSNLKAGFKSFTKKGRELYNSNVKTKVMDTADNLDNIGTNNPVLTSANDTITQTAQDSTSKIQNDVQDTLQGLSGKKEELSTTTTSVVRHLSPEEMKKANRVKMIESWFGKDDVSFYEERPLTLYTRIHNKLYETVRIAPEKYGLRETCNQNIANVTKSQTSAIQVLEQNGWHFRKPVQHIQTPTVDRISLNVYPEDDLIAKLDEYIAKSNGYVSYKTPDCLFEWGNRHDPITIYFKKPVTEEIEKEITKIASPHIRKTNGEVLIGRKIADSIYEVAEPDEKAVRALIERAEKLGFDDGLVSFLKNPDPSFGAQLYETASDGTSHVHSSAGLFEAAKRLVDMAETAMAA